MKKNTSTVKIQNPSVEIQILEAYSRLQYKKGANDVVLQDLADEVGVAFGTVRYHFNENGKDVGQEAVLHVLKTAYAYIDEHLFKARSTKNFNPIKSYIQIMFNWVREFPAESSLIIHYYYLCSTQLEQIIPNQIFLERARLRIEALIHESVGRKIYTSPNDVSSLALQIHMTLLGACMVVGTQRNDKEFDLQVKLCQDIIDQILMKV
ncbi:MAG: TetR/AcrR family transcriptional regulator [Bdellovibrionota bacterium]